MIARLAREIRRRAGALVVDNLFYGLTRVGRLHPDARPARHGVERLENIPYQNSGRPEHRLDVYRPLERNGLLPVLLYVHGGGFRILSKDTHWMMGLSFARHGMVVFNISYRLAPKYPFPAAVEDVCAAYQWVLKHAAAYGGDTSRLVLAGESAGANLVTTLTLCACYRRSEPFARAVFQAGVVPRAVLPACGLFQVSDVDRFARRKCLPFWLNDRLIEVEHDYLGECSSKVSLDLANPLSVFERGEPPTRPLPPFFAVVGTRDPVLDDTRRLAKALTGIGTICEAQYYSGEPHAFHALVHRAAARRCWHDMFAFIDRQVG